MEQVECEYSPLNVEVWEEILSLLDVKSLLSASEVCKEFFYLVSRIKNLMKMKLKLNFDCSDQAEKSIEDLVDLMSNPDELKRNYTNLEVFRFSEAYLDDDVQETFSSFIESISKSGLTSLKFVECEINRDLMISTFQNLQHLTELYVDNVELEVLGAAMSNDEEDGVIAPMHNLRKFHLHKSDFFIFMLIQGCDLEDLLISEPSFSRDDIVKLEDFLLKQHKLKKLTLKDFRFNSSFSSARLADVPFQLENLSLIRIQWDIIDHYEKFVKSQTNLKCVEMATMQIYTDEMCNFISRALKHLVGKNSTLQKLKIDLAISENIVTPTSSIGGIVNENVTELQCQIRHGNSSLANELLGSFPNLKYLKIFQKSNENFSNLPSLTKLEILKMRVNSIDIEGLKFDNLKVFEFSRVNQESKWITKLTKFLQNHQKIKEILLEIEDLSSEELSFLPSSVECLKIKNLCIMSGNCVENITKILPKLTSLITSTPLKSSTKDEIQRKFIQKKIRFEVQEMMEFEEIF